MDETDRLIAKLFKSALIIKSIVRKPSQGIAFCLLVTSDEYDAIRESYLRTGNEFTGKILGCEIKLTDDRNVAGHRIGLRTVAGPMHVEVIS